MMAREIMLVPKEKYQKLLESHKKSLNNRSDTDISNIEDDIVKQRKINHLQDINGDIENNQEMSLDITQKDSQNNRNISLDDVNSTRQKRNSELKGDNGEVEHKYESGKDESHNDGMLTNVKDKEHTDTNYVNLHHNNQSITEKCVHSDTSAEGTTKLAVYKTSADIIKRKRKSSSKRKAIIRKRCLKYN